MNLTVNSVFTTVLAASTFIQNQKKNDRPGGGTPKRSGETNPFEVNVSKPIEHYITSGLDLHTLFQKVR